MDKPATTATTKVAVFKVGMRTFASLAHFECDRPYVDSLMAVSQGDMAAAGTSAAVVAAATDRFYADYARYSDRLCVNLVAYMFPLKQKLAV